MSSSHSEILNYGRGSRSSREEKNFFFYFLCYPPDLPGTSHLSCFIRTILYFVLVKRTEVMPEVEFLLAKDGKKKMSLDQILSIHMGHADSLDTTKSSADCILEEDGEEGII